MDLEGIIALGVYSLEVADMGFEQVSVAVGLPLVVEQEANKLVVVALVAIKEVITLATKQEVTIKQAATKQVVKQPNKTNSKTSVEAK